MTSIGLLAASRMQRGVVCPASEQFDRSPLFRRARDSCERALDGWFVLCPGRPLLAPKQVIGATPASLDALATVARRVWSVAITSALREQAGHMSGEARFVVLTSQRTAELLARAAPDLRLDCPLDGLTLGERPLVRSRLLPAPAR